MSDRELEMQEVVIRQNIRFVMDCIKEAIWAHEQQYHSSK